MFCELVCRTNFSFLRGASQPEEVVEQALALGLHGIAITDRNGVYGMPKAYWRAKDSPNLKFISGAEILLENGKTIVLLAKNRKGYGFMCRILTAAHADKEKGKAFLRMEELTSPSILGEPINGSNLGKYLFCLYAPESHNEPQKEVTLETPQKLKAIFGESFHLILSRFLDGFDEVRTRETLKLSESLNCEIIASNDVHFHMKIRGPLHDALTCVREGTDLTQAGFKLFSNSERYLKSPEQMAKLFRDLPHALSNTVKIADACTFSPSELRYYYPSEWIPDGYTAQEYLTELTWKGAQERYHDKIPLEVEKQIKHELGLIQQLNFADYFLTIYEIVEFARSRDILCQGRGAAANSVVCYALGITAIDPVRMNLLFERFISVERAEPPDIDVDFEHERREEVIQHIYEKYGRHRAAMVSAVVTYRSRSALREIAKSLGVPVGTLSAKKLEAQWDDLVKTSPLPHAKELAAQLIQEMAGFPRHLSIHSGGFTLSAEPIIEIVPVEPARMENRTIIQWDKYDLDYLGLLKVDILSLGMLSAVQKTLKAIGMKLHEVPAEDKATYKMIQRCDTVGVFQIESRAQMSMLGRLQPKSFYDLVIEIAIVRPGPIVGKMVHPYLRRRRGEEKVEYYHPKLKDILGKTLGVPLFQEQVMKMAIELADFTPGEADQLRRAIGAWRAQGSIEMVGKKLLDGLVRNGIPLDYAKNIFEFMKGFAHYGFPESHSASFALIAYVSCYLKCHYPAEFTASVINSQPMGFYQNHSLIDDVKRKNVRVLPIDPNLSQWDCTILKERKVRDAEAKYLARSGLGIGGRGAIRLGFRMISGFAEKDFAHLKAGRPYTSLEHFLAHNQNIRKDVLQRMAMGNLFEFFGLKQRDALWKVLDLQIKSKKSQLSLFDVLESGSSAVSPALPFSDTPSMARLTNSPHPWGKMSVEGKDGQNCAAAEPQFTELNEVETIREDYEAFNASTVGHPMQALRKVLKLPQADTKTARRTPPNTIIEAAGLLIIRQRPPTAKGTTFGTLEDENGFLDLIIREEVWEKFYAEFHDHCFLKVKGKIQRDGHSISMLVQYIKPIFENEAQRDELMIEPTQYYW
jgi:error-prone DNA polymerase